MKKKLKYGEYEVPSKELLRSRGYMTPEEFLGLLVIGLRKRLYNNSSVNQYELIHPEDLAGDALFYMEGVYEIISVFGVRPIKDDEK